MEEIHHKAVCNESLDGNIHLKSNTSILLDTCNNSYTNHTDSYIERE